jgi:predicted unusual protein kinase regulating ubiquinone biosynthesis (AarF/ABC1/UbiB family)
MMQPCSNLRRFVRIFSVCGRHLLAYTFGQKVRGHRILEWCCGIADLSGPERFRIALEEIGGTFIKFGQVLALQSDILPLNYCRELFNLLDRVPPFSFEDVERTFLEELGRKPLEIFDSFDPRPVATGSIGQVHVATLGEQRLAVKVRRPSVLVDFGSDIRLMTFTLRFITALRLKKFYWMIAPITEFVEWTREELDYRREARYMDAIATNATNNPHEKIPTVLWECTTERILTTQYLKALTVLEYMRARDAADERVLKHLESMGFNADCFSRHLIDNFLGDAFRHGMFHADLHPANLMIMPSNSVGYIDFGIAGMLSTYSRYHLVEMTLAYTRADLERMCEAFFRVSAMDARSDANAFRRGLRERSREWYFHDGVKLRLRKSITAIMLDLLTLSRATGIWPQRDVIKYIRSAIALDGLIKGCAPGFDVGRHLETACDRHLYGHSVRALLSPATILRWVEANACLTRDGLLRAAGVITRLAAWHRGVQQRPAGDDRSPSTRSASVRFAAVALMAAMLISGTHLSFAWGFNPQSAGIGVLMAFVAIKLWKIFVTPRREQCA